MHQDNDIYHFYLCPECHRISTRWLASGIGNIYIVWETDRYGNISCKKVDASVAGFVCKRTICPKCGKEFTLNDDNFIIKIFRKDLYIEPVGDYWAHFTLMKPQEFQRILNKVKSQFINLLERDELK